MLRQMLVPLDGSDLAESILPSVKQFAHLTGVSVTLLQVVEPLQTDADATESASADAMFSHRALDAYARDYLADMAAQLAPDGIVTHTWVVHGPVAEQIIQIGADFDLIAMATHGRSGIGRWVYGSVADKVLHGATVPVLLIRAREGGAPVAPPLTNIIVPLDCSAMSEQALPLATLLAQRAHAGITLVQSLHWVEMTAADYPYGYGGFGAGTLLDEAREGADGYLSDVSQRLAEQGITTDTDIRLDPAADGILACAAEKHAGLIVMSTHGRSGIGRWVLGSVADRVLRGAVIPVLLVRAGVPVDAIVAGPLAAMAHQPPSEAPGV